MRILKIVLGVLGVALAVLGGLIAFLALRKPAMRPPSAESVERTPERLARGKYLAEVLVGCMDCHSEHRDDLFGWPAKPETYGQGGFAFDRRFDFPGIIQAQNITPDVETGIGGWTDGEVLRAMREGVDKNGRALFPQMPYKAFRNMDDEDAKSIVVYLRSLKPVKKAIPMPVIDFPVNLLIKLEPKPLEGPVKAPAASDHLAWGKYLVEMASCVDCHTKHEKGKMVEGMEYAGGWVMKAPWGTLVPPNITPDPETGIGNMTKEAFLGRFKAFTSMKEPPPAPAGKNTIMPWLAYSQLSDDELSAIYDYLRTVKPVKNKVVVFPDAT
jgi:mono/diheme cytochrome c family protein